MLDTEKALLEGDGVLTSGEAIASIYVLDFYANPVFSNESTTFLLSQAGFSASALRRG